MTINKCFLSFLLLLSLCGSEAVFSAESCEIVFPEVSGKDEVFSMSPMESTMSQLEARLIRSELLLPFISEQRQRQSKKLMQQLRNIVEGYKKSGDLSERQLDQIVSLGLKLEALEARLMDLESVTHLSSADLSRYLQTRENLNPNFDYTADLPGMGPVRITFSSEITKVMNTQLNVRTAFLPLIFKGLVAKKGQIGIKDLTSSNPDLIKTHDGIVYKLMELKRIGARGEFRFLLVHGSDGSLFFYKFIKNHNRIERVSNGDYMTAFINTYLQE